MELTAMLELTARYGASDLHLSAGLPPLCRLHGRIMALPDSSNVPLGREDVMRLVLSSLDERQRVTFETDRELDFSIHVTGVGRFRGNAFLQLRGVGAVFRVIPTDIPTFEDLGLPSVLKDLALREKGIVLVTGPTGSGKSTTLAAMLDHYNSNRSGHIITVEDPVEFVHTPKRCLINQREVGTHTNSFTAAMRAALREDPDALLVGEMRDLETIRLALMAAETGHLVLATLHTSGAAKSVDRVVSVFPQGEQEHIRTMLAGSMVGVVSQALLPRVDGQGRVAAHEILVCNSAVRALIREGKVHQIPTAIQTGLRFGMQSMEQSLTQLVMKGLLSREVAADYLTAIGGGTAETDGKPARGSGDGGRDAISVPVLKGQGEDRRRNPYT